MAESPGIPDPQQLLADDPRISLQSLVEFSSSTLTPIIEHVVRGNMLGYWCKYVVDYLVHQFYGWEHPDVKHLYWWLNTESDDFVRTWLEQGERSSATTWYTAVATAYFSAANAWFSHDLQDFFVSTRLEHEMAHCRLIDCGDSKGLALDLSISLETSLDDAEVILAQVSDRLRISTEAISLADIRTGIPQILAGSPPGEWLPPFHNGKSWILLQVERHERPTFEELAPRLLHTAMSTWRQQRIQQLTTHWLQVYSASTATPNATVNA